MSRRSLPCRANPGRPGGYANGKRLPRWPASVLQGIKTCQRRWRSYTKCHLRGSRRGPEAASPPPCASPVPPSLSRNSNTVACVAPPSDVDPGKFVARLLKEHGIYISGGLGPLRGKTIRIGTMGTQAEPAVIETFLAAAKSLL